MEHICDNVVLALVLWVGSYVAYLGLNHGLAPNARLQQLLRYLPASIVAVLPLAVTDTDVLQPMVIKLLAIAELWHWHIRLRITLRIATPLPITTIVWIQHLPYTFSVLWAEWRFCCQL